jgi:hypothetical protein
MVVVVGAALKRSWFFCFVAGDLVDEERRKDDKKS